MAGRFSGKLLPIELHFTQTMGGHLYKKNHKGAMYATVVVNIINLRNFNFVFESRNSCASVFILNIWKT